SGSMTTGMIDLTSASGPLILSIESYFLNGDYDGDDETAKVYVSTDAGSTWTEVWDITEAGGDWQNVGTALDYGGQEIWLKFEYDDGNGWNYGWCIDDISIDDPANIREISFGGWNREAFFAGGFEGGLVYPGGYVTNNGVEVLNTIDLTYSDGTNSTTVTFTDLNLGFGQTALLNVQDPFVIPASNTTLSISVGNANGMGPDEDTTNDNGGNLNINVVTPSADRGVLVEEATGTWCVWCPRGTVFLETLTRRYPEKFVGIAVHNDDPMAVTAYDSELTAITGGGWPNGSVERSGDVDPSQFESPFVTAVQQAPPAKLNVGAEYDDATREVTISVDAEYLQDVSSEYKLAAILIENGVTGTSSGYNQANAYAGGGNGPMGGYDLLGGSVPAADMVYDHVGRALIGGFDGEAGSLPASAATGERYGHTFATYTIPNNINTDELYIVGVLLDASSNPVNAVEVSLGDAIAEGIFVSTNDVFAHNEVKISPNPFSEKAFIQLNLESSQRVTVEIVNSVGQSVSRVDYGTLSGAQTLDIDGSNLHSGIYFVHVRMGEKLATKRVTIAK
ncbi:MAG: Omp28-related outer membrane protein, partial [Bacteroidota bacterium]